MRDIRAREKGSEQTLQRVRTWKALPGLETLLGLLSKWKGWWGVGGSRSRWGEVKRSGAEAVPTVLPMLAPGAVITQQFASLSPDRQRLTPASGFTASLGFGDMGFRNFFQDPLRRG